MESLYRVAGFYRLDGEEVPFRGLLYDAKGGKIRGLIYRNDNGTDTTGVTLKGRKLIFERYCGRKTCGGPTTRYDLTRDDESGGEEIEGSYSGTFGAEIPIRMVVTRHPGLGGRRQ